MKFDENYEPDKNRLFLEQYKLYMEMLDRSTKRRMETNTLFISINALIITITSLFNKGDVWVWFLVCLTGYLFSCVWYILLCNYKIVNNVKWDVLYEMEKHLPSNPFETEWNKMKPDNWQEKSNPGFIERISKIGELLTAFFHDDQEYKFISILERHLPVVFALIYIALFIVKCINGNSIPSDLTAAVAEVNDAIAKVNDTLAKVGVSGIG